MNQWELKANTRKRRQARENACDQVAIGLASDWLSRWREFLNQSQNKEEQNQSNSGLLSTLNWKPLLYDDRFTHPWKFIINHDYFI